MRTRDEDPTAGARRLRHRLVTIVSVVLWGFGTHGTHAGSGDEPHLLAAQVGLSAYFWQHPKLLWHEGDGRAAFCARTGERASARNSRRLR